LGGKREARPPIVEGRGEQGRSRERSERGARALTRPERAAFWPVFQDRMLEEFARTYGLLERTVDGGARHAWTNGGGDNLWSNASNWNPAGVPTNVNEAVFDGTSVSNCTIDIAAVASTLTVTSAYTGTISVDGGNDPLTIINSVALSSGVFNLGTSSWTVGGNWSSNSNVTFNAQSSTVMFNGVGGYSILSAGTSFYNVHFNQSGSTWTLSDAFYSTGSFLMSGGQLDTSVSSYTFMVGRDWLLNAGNFKANGSQIRVGRHALIADASGLYTAGTSTITLTGSGNIQAPNNGSRFKNLVQGNGITTTLIDSSRIQGIFTTGDATSIIQDHNLGPTLYVQLEGGSELRNNGATWNNRNKLAILINDGTVDLPAGDYGNIQIRIAKSGVDMTGDVSTGDMNINSNTGTAASLNTQGYRLTVSTLSLGGSGGDLTANGSTITVFQRLSISDYSSGTNTLDAGSANIIVKGNWINNEVFTAGTSVVSFSSTTAGQTVYNNGQAFNVLIASNTNVAGITFTSSFTAAQFLVNTADLSSAATIYFAGNSTFTVSTFTVNGTATNPVILKSTSSAQWFLNVTSSQSVSNVQVSSSNATPSAFTIYALGTSTGTNTTNWNFGAAATNTWTGNVNNQWNIAGNWNQGIVPRSIDNVVIPNTTNKAQLQSAVTINSLNVSQADARLELNNFNLTVSTYVTLVGTMTASGTEQISVGGNWNATGGHFAYAQSTITFNGVGSYNVLSGGTSFYNVYFNQVGSTWTLSDALFVRNNFTQAFGNKFDTRLGSNYEMYIASTAFVNGNFIPNGSTIIVGANFDLYYGTFTYGSSRVRMSGDGTIWYDAGRGNSGFYNLEVSSVGKTTSITKFSGSGYNLSANNRLTINGGTFNTSLSNSGYFGLSGTNPNPLTFTSGWVHSTNSVLIFQPANNSSATVPGYNAYANLYFIGSNNQISLDGDVTCSRLNNIYGTNFTFDQLGNDFVTQSANTLTLGSAGDVTWYTKGGQLSYAGSITLGNGGTYDNTIYSSSSNITVTGNLTLSSNRGRVFGSTSTWNITGNLSVSTGTFYGENSRIDVGGNWTGNLQGVNTFVAGASTVNFSGTAAQTVNPFGAAFATVMSTNNHTSGVTFSSSFTAAQFLVNTSALNHATTIYFAGMSTFTISTFTVNGTATYPVVLKSTSSAQWMLNVTSSQSVSNVSVSSSNATPSAFTIFALGTSTGTNTTNWNFGTAVTNTWTGNVNNRWDVTGNWNQGIVPRAIDNVVIPNTTNKPQLQSATTINSLNINAADARLELNNYDLTVSTYVTLVGTMTASGTEQIYVGGNWNATGGHFAYAQSTVTFNANGGTYSILSAGTSFYNLVITTNTASATYKLADALFIQNNIRVQNGILTTNSSGSYAVNVSSGLYVTGGNFTANASTFTVSGDWVVNPISGLFTANTSRVVMNGTGSIDSSHTSNSFYTLRIAEAGKKITLLSSPYIKLIEFGLGTVTGLPAASLQINIPPAGKVLFNDGVTFDNSAGAYPELFIQMNAGAYSMDGINVGGGIIDLRGLGTPSLDLQTRGIDCGNLWIRFGGAGGRLTFNTNNYPISASSGIIFGWTSGTSGTLFNAGSSTITAATFTIENSTNIINAGTSQWFISSNLDVSTGTFNAESSRINVGGNWIGNAQSANTFVAGTSTVNFNGAAAQSVNPYGTIFATLTSSNSHTSGVTFSSSFTAAQFLVNTSALNHATTIYFAGMSTFTISTFTVNGTATYPVVLKSTSSAQWMLNVTSSQSVSNVSVSSSNATPSAFTIFALGTSTGTNTTNWNFGTAVTNTWTGNVNNRWDVTGNWNQGIVPRAIDNVVIPNTTNKPQLQSATTINSLNINAADARLELNNYDLTVSTYVTLVGTMTASGTEQIYVGGNWNATGGHFAYAQSTVTFNGVGGYNVLTAGTSFYNVNFNQSGSTWTLSDVLFVTNNFTQATGNRFDTRSGSSYEMMIGSSAYFNGDFQANGSTITIGANWDFAIGTFTYSSSRIKLIGDGTLRVDPNVHSRRAVYNLDVASVGKTTVMTSLGTGPFGVSIQNKLNINGGILNTTGLTQQTLTINSNIPDCLAVTPGWSHSTGNTLHFSPQGTSTANIPSSDGYYNLMISFKAALTGNVTCYTLTTGNGPTTMNQNGFDLTHNSGTTLAFGGITWTTSGGKLSWGGTVNFNGWSNSNTINTGSSTVNISGNFNMNAAGSTVNASSSTWNITGDLNVSTGTFNAENSRINVGGNWIGNAQSANTFVAGTSTVNFSGTAAQTINPYGTMFATVMSTNNHTSGVTFSSSFTAAQFLVNTSALSHATTIYFAGTSTFTISTFTVNGTGTYPVVLKSTSSAQWMLNVTSSQSVSNVQVSSSNATPSAFTIYALGTSTGTNTTNWNFGAAATNTWTGNVNNQWNIAGNWNQGIVPRSIDNVVIPNTSNKPQLQYATTINSLNISQGDARLELNNYDLTVSTYVTLVGTMTASGTEQIYVGGNWNATGGAFNAAQSTVTFNGTGAYTVLSAGTSFYNLGFNNGLSTYTLSDALYVKNNFTHQNGSFESGSFEISISSSYYSNSYYNSFNARGSTITVGANFISNNTDAFRPYTSVVKLMGTGVLKNQDSNGGHGFNNLEISSTNQTTSIDWYINVSGVLTTGSGTLTGTGSPYLLVSNGGVIPWVNNGTTISLGSVVYNTTAQSIVSGNYGATPLWIRPSATVRKLIGDVTTSGNFYIGINSGSGRATVDTDGYSLTAGNIILSQASNFTGTLLCRNSNILVTNVTVSSATAIIDASSSVWNVSGNWNNSIGSSFVPGISTVSFTGAAAQTVNPGGQTFATIIASNSHTSGVTFSSSFTAAQFLVNTSALNHATTIYFAGTSTFTISTFTVNGTATYPVILKSTSAAQWMLNVTSSQSVSNVQVSSSNATPSAFTIFAQ
jgi:uncharacterized membrane protein YjdF